MPAAQKFVESLDELTAAAKPVLEKKHHVFVMMTGSTDLKTGDSWSEDCRKAEPVLESSLKKSADGDLFMMLEVGSKEQWENPKNAYKTNSVYQLKELPTLFSLKLVDGAIAVDKKIEGKSLQQETSVHTLLGLK